MQLEVNCCIVGFACFNLLDTPKLSPSGWTNLCSISVCESSGGSTFSYGFYCKFFSMIWPCLFLCWKLLHIFLPKRGNDASGRCTEFILWLYLSQVGGAQLYINGADLSVVLPQNHDHLTFHQTVSNSQNSFPPLPRIAPAAHRLTEENPLLTSNPFCQDSIYLNNLILITGSSYLSLRLLYKSFQGNGPYTSLIYTSITCENSWDPMGSNQYLQTDWLAQCSLKSIFIFIW